MSLTDAPTSSSKVSTVDAPPASSKPSASFGSKPADQVVRDTAVMLADAIAAAVAEGYRVDWPSNAAGLPSIAVSATGKTA